MSVDTALDCVQKSLCWGLILLSAVTAVEAAQPQPVLVDRIMAVVSGRLILLSDVRSALNLQLVAHEAEADPYATILDRLIDREVILVEVERYVPSEPEAAVIEARVNEVVGRFPSREAFMAALAANGLSEAEVAAFVRQDIQVQEYLVQRFGATSQVTEDEVVRYYQAHQGEFVERGRRLPFEEVRDRLRARLGAALRQNLIGQWLADLRRRTDITILYHPQHR